MYPPARDRTASARRTASRPAATSSAYKARASSRISARSGWNTIRRCRSVHAGECAPCGRAPRPAAARSALPVLGLV